MPRNFNESASDAVCNAAVCNAAMRKHVNATLARPAGLSCLIGV